MNVGDIAIAMLPQADGSQKPRPVLLLKQMPPFQDWLVCGISTQLRQFVANFDEMLDENHPDYEMSGLVAPSIVRLGFLSVLPENRIRGTLGNLSSTTYQSLMDRLVAHLQS